MAQDKKPTRMNNRCKSDGLVVRTSRKKQLKSMVRESSCNRLHFGPPGLENRPSGFILTPGGAPSGPQKVAEHLFFWIFSDVSGR